MSKENQIKREDIISDKALKWPKNYTKTVNKAIKANKKLIKSIKKLRKHLGKL